MCFSCFRPKSKLPTAQQVDVEHFKATANKGALHRDTAFAECLSAELADEAAAFMDMGPDQTAARKVSKKPAGTAIQEPAATVITKDYKEPDSTGIKWLPQTGDAHDVEVADSRAPSQDIGFRHANPSWDSWDCYSPSCLCSTGAQPGSQSPREPKFSMSRECSPNSVKGGEKGALPSSPQHSDAAVLMAENVSLSAPTHPTDSCRIESSMPLAEANVDVLVSCSDATEACPPEQSLDASAPHEYEAEDRQIPAALASSCSMSSNCSTTCSSPCGSPPTSPPNSGLGDMDSVGEACDVGAQEEGTMSSSQHAPALGQSGTESPPGHSNMMGTIKACDATEGFGLKTRGGDAHGEDWLDTRSRDCNACAEDEDPTSLDKHLIAFVGACVRNGGSKHAQDVAPESFRKKDQVSQPDLLFGRRSVEMPAIREAGESLSRIRHALSPPSTSPQDSGHSSYQTFRTSTPSPLSEIISQLDFSSSRGFASPMTGQSTSAHTRLTSPSEVSTSSWSSALEVSSLSPDEGASTKVQTLLTDPIYRQQAPMKPVPIVSAKPKAHVVSVQQSGRYGLHQLSGYRGNVCAQHSRSATHGHIPSTSSGNHVISAYSIDHKQGFSSAASRMALRGGLPSSLGTGTSMSGRRTRD